MTTELKPMSPAEYRANTEKTKAGRATEIVQLQSGAVFELRRPELYSYMITGRLPQSLVSVGFKAWRKGAEQATRDLKDEEAADMFVFMREIVHDCTVNPKFVEFAVNDNEIGASDMALEDFNEIFEWAMSHQGVAGLAGLQSFRQGRERRTVTDSVDGAEQRSESEQSVEAGDIVQ